MNPGERVPQKPPALLRYPQKVFGVHAFYVVFIDVPPRQLRERKYLIINVRADLVCRPVKDSFFNFYFMISQLVYKYYIDNGVK